MKMKPQHAAALALGIGMVSGLRPLTAPAVIAWAVKRGWIRQGHSPFARIVSANASRRIAELAMSELISDKLPFTASRLNAAPLASRIASGAICGAAIQGTMRRPLAQGAALGALGALVGAITGYHVRRKLNSDASDFVVAILEDALAIGGGAMIVTFAAAAE